MTLWLNNIISLYIIVINYLLFNLDFSYENIIIFFARAKFQFFIP